MRCDRETYGQVLTAHHPHSRSVHTAPRLTAALLAARAERDGQAVADRQSLIDRNLARIKAEYDEYKAGRATGPPVVDLLVVSGGADWGAFGAGFLKGWDEVPDGAIRRPHF